MSEYKYVLDIYEIVDEMGDLKFVGKYYTNVIPNAKDQIEVLYHEDDEQGKFIKRLFYEVQHRVFYGVANIDISDSIANRSDVCMALNCKLLLHEDL